MADTERLKKHPVLSIPEKKQFTFYFNDKEFTACEGEVISSSLFANGINVFGHHYIDDNPLGIFCANGQCSQCMVIADGKAVKACMTETRPGMRVFPCDGLPALPDDPDYSHKFSPTETLKCEVLIIGGGPSGAAAAIELSKLGHSVILVDDKDRLGGKLVLQTHTFFGSIDDCHAGTRGIDIASILENEINKSDNVGVFLNSTAVGVFSDRRVGILQGEKYFLIEPERLLIACGAREKALNFPGWDLPGVYGAGAFQTLLNRDLVRPSKRLFVIGGGNVGIIAAYHALQAGITVVGLAEALPDVSGYKVHADKLKRFGVPLYLSHSVLKAQGDEKGVKTITIAQVDRDFQPIEGTEKVFEVDTILLAVGLTPISELYDMAKDAGMRAYITGDSKEIAEASAAMFGGKISGLTIAGDMGDNVSIPPEWHEKEEILKSRPGPVSKSHFAYKNEGIFPVFHCSQEIPCNPCTEVCPNESILIENNSIMGLPQYISGGRECTGCSKCVAICPGLAITIVDFKKADKGFARVTIPFELSADLIREGSLIPVVDVDGNVLADGEIMKINDRKFADRTLLVTLNVPGDLAAKVAGVRIQSREDVKPLKIGDKVELNRGETVVCSCMRISDEEIRRKIRAGARDMNQIKAELNAGMGACGGRTCEQLILRIFREEGVASEEIVPYIKRTPNVEIHMGTLAGYRD